METFIRNIPKAELHLHIEGTFEPEQMFRIAERNHIKIPYLTVDEIRDAYKFSNLQDFLNIYYASTNVLVQEQDFYDLTWAYLKKMHEQHVVHTELFFDPQSHTSRGVSFETVISGIHHALMDAEKEFGITSKLIMSILRHLSESSAISSLNEALPFKDWITGIGLDSSEEGHPPSKFRNVFLRARQEGFICVAHAGEEGPPSYVREAIYHLGVTRIDHGNRSIEDMDLINELVDRQMPLTLCPLSNLKLQVIKDLKDHPLKKMMNYGLLVTVNSDDPAYFGGYLNENLLSVAKALSLTKYDIYRLARNSFTSSLMEEELKLKHIQEVEDYYHQAIKELP